MARRERGGERAGGGETFVGLLDKRGKFLTAEPFFDRGRRIVVDRHRDAGPGKLALLRAPKGGRGRAEVVRILGRPGVARDVIEALMLDRGLPRRFPPGVERSAGGVRDEPHEVPGRRDLVDRVTFTIDPATAKDFDDAISAERLGDGHWRIWVHIADVSAFVRPGSPVDREAYRRATSVYVPGAVEPMLPEALSNDACSLVPGRERLAVTVEMEMRGPKVVKATFYRSTIRSDERLDYEQVDRIFAGEERAREPWADPLAVAREAAAALDAARGARGRALVIEAAEPEFAFDPRGHLTAAVQRTQTESHRLIEHLMIAANEQVATLLSDRGIPALYRVHERPDGEAVQRLVDQLESLGVPTPPLPEHPSQQEAADAVASISREVEAHVERTGRGRKALTSLVLRSLKQASYTPENRGHSGLGLTHYCHYTSPIRRYPDLICHRALLSAVGGGEETPPGSGLAEAGAWTSARERDAMSIERSADDVARCFLLERHLFENGWKQEFDGEVIGLIGAGAFVAFGEGYEGMLPVRRLHGDTPSGARSWWELNEQGTMLVGTKSGDTIRLGDEVRVTVRSIEAPRGRVDLDLAAG